jgi:hypothetical protein
VSAVTLLIAFVTLAFVLVVANGVLRQAGEDEALVFSRLAINPRLEVCAHLTLDLRVVIVEVRVVEGGEDCGEGLVSFKVRRKQKKRKPTVVSDGARVDAVVLPSLDDLLNGVGEDEDRDLSGGLVEDEGEAAKEEENQRWKSEYNGRGEAHWSLERKEWVGSLECALLKTSN